VRGRLAATFAHHREALVRAQYIHMLTGYGAPG
jgi:hypothetical protein